MGTPGEHENIIGDQPWLLMGDFIIIRYCVEKIVNAGYDFDAMTKFNNCLSSIDVDDMPSKGIFLM